MLWLHWAEINHCLCNIDDLTCNNLVIPTYIGTYTYGCCFGFVLYLAKPRQFELRLPYRLTPFSKNSVIGLNIVNQDPIYQNVGPWSLAFLKDIKWQCNNFVLFFLVYNFHMRQNPSCVVWDKAIKQCCCFPENLVWQDD